MPSLPKRLAPLLFLGFAVLLVFSACAARGKDAEIPRERAIALARRHLKFESRSVEAEKTEEQGRPVWRVTFHGAPVGQVPFGDVLIVVLDRRTGEVVSIAMS